MPVPAAANQPQHQIPLFSLQDMRFFQHFLQHATPHQPLGNESIWTHEVPVLSHNHEFLMHAILGLAASDLMQRDPSLVAPAMHHRLKAIRAIKKALGDMSRSAQQRPQPNAYWEAGNALMATCYALTFQSVMLDDGMAEYMTFIRGIVIVAMQMYFKGSRFIFHDFIGHEAMEIVRPLMEVLPLIHQPWAESAVASISGLEPLCSSDVEREYQALLMEMSTALMVSSFKGKLFWNRLGRGEVAGRLDWDRSDGLSFENASLPRILSQVSKR